MEVLMKRNIIALTIIAAIVLLGGCDKSRPQSEASSDVGGTVGDNSTESGEKKEIVFADFEGEYPENPIQIMTLSQSEIVQKINAQSNFKCSDNLYVNIPEKASVYEYHTYNVHVPQFNYPVAQYTEDFNSVFKYFFPDREMNIDYLKYNKYLGFETGVGAISEEGYVKDKESLPDLVDFTYDEKFDTNNPEKTPTYLEMLFEIGGGGGIVNKGESARLAKRTGNLVSFEPAGVFEYVGKYSPQSEKSFNLLDGEIKICDAVKFFEDYINKAPISTGLERNTRTRVYCVNVLKTGDNTYGYYFYTVPEFQGVCFEPTVYGQNSHHDTDPTRGEAFMIRSDDVDYIHSYYGNQWTFNVKPCDSIIPVDKAIEIMSGKLSDAVNFDVQTVEFVYVRVLDKTEEGYINIDTYEGKIRPAWRITARNLNDDYTYMCYVDAKDGGNFIYYSSMSVSDYDD